MTHHRTAKVDRLDIFFHKAGPADAPAVLFLHGFPTSSHMFRNLIPALANEYHVIAPDYPGHGQSDIPDRATFAHCGFSRRSMEDHGRAGYHDEGRTPTRKWLERPTSLEGVSTFDVAHDRRE